MLFKIVCTVVLILAFVSTIRLLFADVSDVDLMCQETGRFLIVSFVLIILLGFLEYVLYFLTGKVI